MPLHGSRCPRGDGPFFHPEDTCVSTLSLSQLQQLDGENSRDPEKAGLLRQKESRFLREGEWGTSAELWDASKKGACTVPGSWGFLVTAANQRGHSGYCRESETQVVAAAWCHAPSGRSVSLCFPPSVLALSKSLAPARGGCSVEVDLVYKGHVCWGHSHL